ncbi:MAG TPA: bifunctional demethylmenaquinone methyltransferase/2-methoxy-6-polyprenyl-1,4-benzoquinol methylase UbiE [Puia sp.]
MPEYQHDKIVPFKDSDIPKKEQVAEMFNRIAYRYDFLNHFLSAGIDKSWRKKAIQELGSVKPHAILDVATGTADMPVMMMKFLSPERIVGIDISEGMLELGKQKIAKAGLQKLIFLQTGDAEDIGFPDCSFDGISVSFGVRNFQNLERGLSEMYRVLKPGGKLVILEFSKPKKGIFLPFYSVYLRLIAPRIGKMFSGNAEAYKYLNESVNAFPEGNALTGILDKTGYQHTRFRKLSLGICAIYSGIK